MTEKIKRYRAVDIPLFSSEQYCMESDVVKLEEIISRLETQLHAKKKLNPHRMDYSKVKLLMRIASVNKTHEWVKIQQDMALIKDDEAEYTIQCDAVHATRLKWYGLLELKKRRSGLYKINKDGIAFLKNELEIPEVIYCRSGVVHERSEKKVMLQDVKGVVLDKDYWDDYPNRELPIDTKPNNLNSQVIYT